MTCSSASQPGAPRRSKHASCGLTATQAGPAASISARQWTSTAAAASAGGGAGPGGAGAGGGSRVDERDREALALLPDGFAGIGPEAGGIGIDPEDDLRLARGDCLR